MHRYFKILSNLVKKPKLKCHIAFRIRDFKSKLFSIIPERLGEFYRTDMADDVP